MNSFPLTKHLIRSLLLAGLVLATSLSAQQTPGQIEPKHANFSGRWRMVKSQSNFGSFHMPDIVVRVVDQRDATMNVHTVQTTGDKTNTNDLSYFTDGTITKNVINGRDAESKGFWDGQVLVIRTSMKTRAGRTN